MKIFSMSGLPTFYPHGVRYNPKDGVSNKIRAYHSSMEGILFKFTNMEKLPNIHPGEILHEEFLIPLLITPYRLAKETNIPQTRVSEIIKGNRRITADTALRLSQFFGNSAKFWLGLQDDFDIENELGEKHEEFGHIKRFEAAL